jgi:hypothetical protein
MFKTQPWTFRRLMFIVDPDQSAGGGTSTPGSGEGEFLPADEQLTDDEFLAKRGFPRGVKREDMPIEQQLTSLRYEARKWQYLRDAEKRSLAAYAKFGTVEDLQSATDAAETARLASLDDNQRAIEEARATARAEALAENGTKHLDSAVMGMLIALTKGAEETFEDAQARVAGAIEFADITKFVGDNGALDAAKVQTFAKSIGSAGNGDVSTNRNAAWGAQYDRDHAGRIPPAPGSAGSVETMKQAALDRMKKNKA